VEGGRRGSARVAVLTIIKDEFAAVSKSLGLTHNLDDSPYYCADKDTSDVVLRQAPDRSQAPAMSVARQMLEHFRPEVLILVGIAGGIEGRDEVALGDVVVPNYIHYGEFRKLTEQGDLRRHIAFDQPAVSLRERYVHPASLGEWHSEIPVTAPEDNGTPKVIEGSLVSGEKVYGDPSHYEQRALVAQYSDAVAVDMESYGVGRAVYESRDDVGYNPRLLVVRGISDLVKAADDIAERDAASVHADDNNRQRAVWKEFAAASAAAFASQVITRFMRTPDPRGSRGRSAEPEALT
jgi:nucleoside phosphorylase